MAAATVITSDLTMYVRDYNYCHDLQTDYRLGLVMESIRQLLNSYK
jgi:protein subunit release factor A